MKANLRIQMFGPIEFFAGDKAITSHLSMKSLAILCFLLCHKQHKITREKLATMLWPENYDTATYNLRYNLWNIKKVIPCDENGEEFLLTSKETCAINSAYQYVSDLDEVEKLEGLSPEETEQAALLTFKDILSHEFMEDFYIRDNDDFNNWILFERTRYQKLFQQIMERLYQTYMADRDISNAEKILQDLLKINPYEEEYYCRSILIHLERGERHEAIQCYRQCEELLRKDLNLAPSKKLRELYLNMSQVQDETVLGTEKKHLVLNLFARKEARSISGLALSELIEMAVHTCDRTVISKVSKVFMEDMAAIQPTLIPACGLDGGCREVKEARLLNSLRGFFTQISPWYQISVRVHGMEWLDPLSKAGLDYLSYACPDTFEWLEIGEQADV